MQRFIELYREENETYRILASWDNNLNQVLSEGYKKEKDGLWYYIQRNPEFNREQFKQDIVKKGWFSKRPYTLAQSCDGTITNPVLALFQDYCQHKGLDPDKLLLESYPKEKEKMNWTVILEDANWQGIAVPKSWGENEKEGLIESLTEINYHSLVNTLSDIDGREDELKRKRGERKSKSEGREI